MTVLDLTPSMVITPGDRVIVRRAESYRARQAAASRRAKELRDARLKIEVASLLQEENG
jgi:hypothetical protein